MSDREGRNIFGVIYSSYLLKHFEGKVYTVFCQDWGECIFSNFLSSSRSVMVFFVFFPLTSLLCHTVSVLKPQLVSTLLLELYSMTSPG